MMGFTNPMHGIYTGGRVILFILIGVMVYQYLEPRVVIIYESPLPRIVNEAEIIRNSDIYIETVMQTLTILSLALLLILTTFPKIKTFKIIMGYRILGSAIFLGILVANITLINWTLYTDPRAYYGTGEFRPRVPENRNLILQRYHELHHTPDFVVFGSSHANTIDPMYAEKISGLTTFNASVQGGTPEYGLALFKYLTHIEDQTFPPVILFEVAPTLASFQSMRWLPLPLIPYTRSNTMYFIVEDRLTSYLNLQQISEGVLVYMAQTKYYVPPQIVVAEHGSTIRPMVENPMTEDTFNQIIERDIRFRGVPTCPNNELDSVGKESIEEMVRLAEKENSAIIFYVNPNHPAFYEARIRNRRLVENCYVLFNDFFEGLAAEYEYIYYLDYSDITTIDGDITRDGYYDSHHLTWHNNDRLLDEAMPTIQQAYQYAQNIRALE